MAETTLKVNAQDNASAALDTVNKSLKSMVELLGASEIIKAMGDATKEFGEMEQNSVRLDLALKNNNQYFGLTQEGLDALTKSIYESGTAEDDMIKKSETLLLSFHNLGKNGFEETLKASNDLAAGLGIALPQAAEMLGKALENPEKGVRMLRQANIILSQAEQEEIKTLQESGRIHEAQAIILEKVNGVYKGAAEAISKTFLGSVEKMNNEVKGANETFGEMISQYLKPLVETITSVVKWFNQLDKGTKDTIATAILAVGAIALITAGISGLVGAVQVLTMAMAANPIGLIAVGVAAAIVGIALLIKNFDMIKLQIEKFAEGAGHNLYQFFQSIKLFSLEMASNVTANIARMTKGAIDALNVALEAMHLPKLSYVFDDATDAILRMEHATRGEMRTEEQQHNTRKAQIEAQIEALKKKNDNTKDGEDLLKQYNKELENENKILGDLAQKRADFHSKLTMDIASERGDTLAAINEEEKARIAQLKDLQLADKEEQEEEDRVHVLYNKKREKDYAATAQKIMGIINSMVSSLTSSINQYYQNDIDRSQNALERRLSVLDEQEQAEIATAEAAGESTAGITERYEEQKTALKKKAAMSEYKLKVDQFHTDQTLAVVTAVIQGAGAVMQTMSQFGYPWGLIPAGLMAAMTGIEIGAIMGQQPPAMPSFATGGVAPGGLALVGERGPEIVNLPAGSRVFNNEESRGMMGGESYTFNGPITVKADNPQEFYARMRAQARYERGRA